MTTDDLKAWLLLAGFKYNSEENRYSYSKHGLVKLITVKFMPVPQCRTLLGGIRVNPVYDKYGPLHFSCSKQAQKYIQKLIGE